MIKLKLHLFVVAAMLDLGALTCAFTEGLY